MVCWRAEISGDGMSRIVVAGAAGRMGRMLVRAITERTDLQLAGATEHPQSPHLGTDVGLLIGNDPLGVTIDPGIDEVSTEFETIVDFTSPDNTRQLLQYAQSKGKRLVIGTTGLTEEDQQHIKTTSEQIAVVFAANYSVGATLSLDLLAHAATVLGDDYDIEIIEAHHKHKKDAPSGTAKVMGQVVAKAVGRDFNECAVYAREGITGERKDKTIGFSTIRAGEIIGEHTVLFCGQGEQLEVTHKATDRMTFARGAIRAASWLGTQPAGLYDMSDVVRL